MSDQEKPKGQGIAKLYLNLLDTSVLFKKPISCLFAVISLLIPVYFLILAIQGGLFSSRQPMFIVASILILAVLAFAGILGCLIWWHRRITRDEGAKWYANFRRFIQTLGEWSGTLFAIIVFGTVLVLMLLLPKDAYSVIRLLPLRIAGINLTFALYGPIVGFLIIIATKILLFLLDPVIWLIKEIWKLFVRVVLYLYRCVLKLFGIVEQNTSVWMGAIWILAVAVVVCGLVLTFALFRRQLTVFMWSGAITLALGLGFMAFLVVKRKNDNE